MTLPAAIELECVDFAYRTDVVVFEGLDLRVGNGLTLLLGPNGSGKSTLMKLAAGIEMPDEGRVMIRGFDLWRDEVAARSCLAYVPELPDLTPYASIREVLELVCRLRRVPAVGVGEVLAGFDLEGVAGRSVRELSKGQRRRALLAAARLGEPPVLLLDEPLDALDRPLRAEVLRWIERHCLEGGDGLVVAHEIEPFARLAQRAVGVVDGIVCLVDSLPEDGQERLRVLEDLASGRDPSSRPRLGGDR